jgi:hypothetical protein
MIAVLVLWLLGSTPAHAGELSDRISQFPDWQSKPSLQAAQGDLVYPEWFLGTWNVTTTLVELIAPLAPELMTPGFEGNRQLLQKPVVFQARFLQAPVHTEKRLNQPFPALNRRSPSHSIVADRAFNGLNLTKAYLTPSNQKQLRVSVQVDPTNPNRQITRLRAETDSSTQERQLVSTIVTRATESPTEKQFITTEVFQQEFLGAPQVFFNTVEATTAYKRSADPDRMSADQMTAVFLSPQDPDFFKAGDRPVALYRYRLEFLRTRGNDQNL